MTACTRSPIPVLLLGLVVAVLSAVGCGEHGGVRPATALPSPVAQPSSPFSSPSALSARPFTYPARSDLRSAPAPGFACREFKLDGTYRLLGATGNLCCLLRDRYDIAYPLTQVYLLDLSTETLRAILPMPVNASRRYTIMTPRLSDGWLVWEELSPGDDLMRPAHWRLYATRITDDGRSLGRPRLVDRGYTPRRGRPLFALDGDTLTWSVTVGSRHDWCETVRVMDLGQKSARVVVRTPPQTRIDHPGLDGRAVWFTMPRTSRSAASILRVYEPPYDGPAAALPLRNGSREVSYFSALHRGWFAWTVHREASGAGITFLREPGGRVHRLRSGGAPLFASRYLFYGSTTWDGVSQFWGVDLAAMTLFEMTDLQTEADFQGEWLHPGHSAYGDGYLVVCRDERSFMGARGQHTYLRAYDLGSVTGPPASASPSPAPTISPVEILTAGL